MSEVPVGLRLVGIVEWRVCVSYWRLYYHLVWSTKLREPSLDGNQVTELQRAIWKSVEDLKIQLLALGIQPDHVHVAYSAPPSLSVSDVAQRLKGSSSHFLGKQFPGDWPGWQKEYGVVGIGQRSLPRVVAYVNNQTQHHREQSLWLEMERGLDDPIERTIVAVSSPNGTSEI
jgi:putative transposase